MSDYADRYADKQADVLAREIAKVYREARSDLWGKIQAFIKRFKAEDAAKRKKLNNGELTAAEYKKWLQRQVFDGKRWIRLRKSAANVLTEADKQAANIINLGSMKVFREAANFAAYDIEKNLEGAVSFDIYDEPTITRLIADNPELLPRRVINGKIADAWNAKQITNAAMQGVIQGESIPDIAKRIARDTGLNSTKTATRYARTAMAGAHNAGRFERMHEAQSMGIAIKKKWLATLDGKTRDAHQKLDGQEQEIDKPFKVDGMDIMFPGDPTAPAGLIWNCRCRMINVYPKYAHLHKGQRRDAETGELYNDTITYAQWKKMKGV